MRIGPLDAFRLLILSILWGGTFIFIEIALREATPLLIVFLRVAIAAACLWAVVLVSRMQLPMNWNVVGLFLVMGTLNNAVPFCLLTWSQVYLSAGMVSILNAATPLFTTVLATAILADERATPLRVFGTVVGFGGVATLLGGGASADGGLLPIGASLVAAASYAVAGIVGRRLSALGINPVVSSAGQLTASSCLLLPIAAFSGAFALIPTSATVWTSILMLATVSTAIAYILYFQILRSAGASNLMLVTFLIPVTATSMGLWLLGESASLFQLAGGAILLVGLLLIDGRLFRRREPG